MTAPPEVDTRGQRSGETRSRITQDFKYLFMIDDDRGSKVPRYMKWPGPSEEICDNAKCSPDLAYLWDPESPEERREHGYRAVQRRQAVAADICRECPVWEACLEYGVKHQLTGVYGGTVLTENMYRRQQQEASRNAD